MHVVALALRRAVVPAVGLVVAFGAVAVAQDLPEGFQQVLPRGRIPAIDNPEYVSADEARIRDEAWVLGVVIEGQARAYSLNLLNHHEVVNDNVAGTDYAAVW